LGAPQAGNVFEENDPEGVAFEYEVLERTEAALIVSEAAGFSTSKIPQRALSRSFAAAHVAPLPVQFEGEGLQRFREILSLSRKPTMPEIFQRALAQLLSPLVRAGFCTLTSYGKFSLKMRIRCCAALRVILADASFNLHYVGRDRYGDASASLMS
jgi:hypothetical protein